MASPRSGASILITSAPSSRRRCDAYGPAITWLKSATRIPSSGFPIISSLTLYLAAVAQAVGNRPRAAKARHRVDAVAGQLPRALLGIALVDEVEALLVSLRHIEKFHALLVSGLLSRVLGLDDLGGQRIFPDRNA